jgi:hypothetical protein
MQDLINLTVSEHWPDVSRTPDPVPSADGFLPEPSVTPAPVAPLASGLQPDPWSDFTAL